MIMKLFPAAVALIALGTAMTAQKRDDWSAQGVSPASGAGMYRTYCASCHGVDGKGRGPAAPAMKAPPVDLTTLARRHGGKFPEILVFQTIEGDASMAAHGSREMPVWGTVFRGLGGSDEARVKLRVRNLTRHIQSLQQ